MNVYLCYAFLTVIKIFNFNAYINVRAANIKNSYKTKTDLSTPEYRDIEILQQVLCIETPLTKIFPFLSGIEGLCVEFYIEYRDTGYPDTDSLNLGECKTIKSFRLKGSNIRELPEYIKSFKYINNICFLENDLTSSCFDIISQLSTLRSLNLGYNSIEKIPENILQLVNLKELTLSSAKFIDVPEFLSNIKLKKLDISRLCFIFDSSMEENTKNNAVKNIVNNILKIKTLETFILNDNNLYTLGFYDKDYNIKRLELSNNKLSTLPDSIINLKKLEYLDLKSNDFRIVPPILAKLENLKILDLVTNYIDSYQNLNFYSLETLRISFDVEYENEGFSVKNVKSSLKHLQIYTSPYFHKVRSQIYNMVDLKSLFIFGPIKIEKYDAFHKLKNLETLYFSYIILNEFSYSICELKNLRNLYLNLHAYEKEGFSEEIFSCLTKLKNLEYLSIKDFNVSSVLYDKIFDLENLKALELYGFLINNIEGFKKMKKLKHLVIEKSSFTEPKEKVMLYLNHSNKRIQYKSCTYKLIERRYICNVS